MPRKHGKLQANKEPRAMLDIGRPSDKADVARLTDAELVQQLADQARQFRVKVDLNYRFLQGNVTPNETDDAQGKKAQSRTPTLAELDSIVSTLVPPRWRRRYEQFGVRTSQGDAFKLAREGNPGKWSWKLLHQLEAERDQFLVRLKESEPGPECRIGQIDRFEAQQRSVKNLRALNNAYARDRIDAWLANLEDKARRLKKTNDDSLNVGLLVKHVDTLADALASYEEKNELEFGDPYLLDKLHGILCLVQDLTGPIDKMTKDRAKMVSIRAKRSSKSLNREKELIELAIASLKQNRKQSSKRAVAHNIAPTVGLKPNTVEKKLAPVWATVQKSMPSK